ncbi:MAG: sugar phosphate isomerase/epimerase [Defluviitaleaceae bacterium]|nr:sugar phosphate isomerase/epimerase [Defluviitaleaceae bacterium]
MEFGCCLSLGDIARKGLVEGFLRAGYGYIELPARDVAGLDNGAFMALRGEIAAHGVPVPAMNLFLPAGMKVTGSDACLPALKEYAKALFARCGEIGCRVMVFGSAGARNLAEGFPVETAKAQMAEALAMLSELAAPYGLLIGLEPLNRGECNFINSLADGLSIVKAANLPNVGLTADFYHMSVNAEPVAGHLKACGKSVFHTHFADPKGRVFPIAENPEFREFFRGLKEAGYDGRMSIEAGSSDVLADAGKSIGVLLHSQGAF